MVEGLDAQLAELEARIALPRAFVVPGGTPVAATVDLARTLVRRAERRAVSLRRAGALENPEVLRYLNRLSDLLFMIAREAEGGATTPGEVAPSRSARRRRGRRWPAATKPWAPIPLRGPGCPLRAKTPARRRAPGADALARRAPGMIEP